MSHIETGFKETFHQPGLNEQALIDLVTWRIALNTHSLDHCVSIAMDPGDKIPPLETFQIKIDKIVRLKRQTRVHYSKIWPDQTAMIAGKIMQ